MGRPNPDGWKGGSEDFDFVTTYDGHLGNNQYEVEQNPAATADEDARRNARSDFIGGS